MSKPANRMRLTPVAVARSGDSRFDALSIGWLTVLMIVCSQLSAAWCGAQDLRSSRSPGTVARARLLDDPSLGCYYQPVKIIVPNNATISSWNQGGEPRSPSILVGLTVGPVYRLKVSNIFLKPGVDIYPSIEMLDRLYPPPKLALKHPVKIVLDQDDLDRASKGQLVTKVIYLEDPMTALPYRQQNNHQSSFDVSFVEDPLQIADRLGRPMAIVRIGSRKPIPSDSDGSFDFNNPPVQFYEEVPGQQSNTADAQNSATDVINDSEIEQVNYNPPKGEATGEATAGLHRHRHRPRQHCARCAQPAQICQCGDCQQQYGGPCSSALPLGMACPPSKHRIMRDEYICDGFDREPSVRVDSDWNVDGLDIEDTIGHFDTLQGERLVAPSNRVCIYAPRFAAVRKVNDLGRGRFATRLAAVKEKENTVETRGEDFTATTLQQLKLQSNRNTIRPGAIRDRTRGVTADNTTQIRGSQASLKPYSNLQLIKFGEHSNSESARLNLGMQSAVVWDENVALQMTVKNAEAVIVNDVVKLQEIVSIQSEFHSTLRLVKLASRISAEPGEIVDFTIRFDNLGNQRIGNVTIIDNLSPRLEFIPGSASCTLDAKLVTEENEAGSLTLSWEITEPMEKGQGGVIQFQCRVR